MTRKREVMVGVVIVVGITVAVLGTLWLQGVQWRRDVTRIDVLATDAGQLMEGNAVKVRGVNIGKVESITVEPGGNAVRVGLLIDGNVSLPEDPVAMLAMESMFGDWQAEILSRERFPWLNYMEVDEPGTLGGYALPDMSRLTATADRISESLAVLTERVELAFTEETAINIRDAIDNIQDVSEKLTLLVGQQAETFDRVADEVQVAASEVGAAARSARTTMDNVNGYLDGGEVDSLVANARAAAANIRALSEELGGAAGDVQSTLKRADSTLAGFERITARIESGDGALGRLVTDTALVSRAESALQELNLLLVDFRENPKRYVRLSIF